MEVWWGAAITTRIHIWHVISLFDEDEGEYCKSAKEYSAIIERSHVLNSLLDDDEDDAQMCWWQDDWVQFLNVFILWYIEKKYNINTIYREAVYKGQLEC